MPVDFEAGQSRLDQLPSASFDAGKPAVVASTGVSMYLTRAAGFGDVRHVSAPELAERYFAGRSDGFRPLSGEEMLVATV